MKTSDKTANPSSMEKTAMATLETRRLHGTERAVLNGSMIFAIQLQSYILSVESSPILIRCQAKFLTSSQMRMHRVIFCTSKTLRKLMI